MEPNALERNSVRHVLDSLGLMDSDGVARAAEEVAKAVTPAQNRLVAKLLVGCLHAHHRLMVRQIAQRLGETLHQFAHLRETYDVE